MQKKIIALAVAGLASTAAFAQTNVTVYGIVDLSQAYVAVSGSDSAQASVLRQDSNSSYIGFKGVEDLGNGLKAVFQLESGVNPDATGGTWANRDSYVGLAGGFGTVVLGNLTHPLRTMGANVELMPGAAGLGTTASVTGSILGLKSGADERAQNAVAYVSPTFFGGLNVTGAYTNSAYKNGDTSGVESRDGGKNPHAYQLAAQYAASGLYAGLGYHKVFDIGTNGSTVTASNDDTAQVIRAAAAYTFASKTKVTALWDNTRVSLTSNSGDARRNAFSLGLSQGFGKNTVGVEYGYSTKVKLAGSDLDNSSSSIASLVYSYELSKRTMLHARASRLNNSANNANQFYNNRVSDNITGAATAGADYTGVLVGIRHAF